MKNISYRKLLLGVVTFIILSSIFISASIDHWVHKKMETALNGTNSQYIVKIENVHVTILKSEVEFKKLSVSSSQKQFKNSNIQAHIETVHINGINLWKLLLWNDLDIDEVSLANFTISGILYDPVENIKAIISSLNIRMGKMNVNKLNIDLKNNSNAQSYSIKKGDLNIYNILVFKNDTLGANILKKFDFKAEKLFAVQADSLYSYTVNGFILSDSAKNLSIDSILIHPNYEDYEFASLHKFESDRIEALFKNIHASDVSAAEYLHSGSLESTYLEIGSIDINVFRDKHKPANHENKTEFQDLIYNYRGMINIDSIAIIEGNISYTEHEKLASDAGIVYFNNVSAHIYNLTKLKEYNTESEFMVLEAKSQFMGEAEVNVILKAEIFDSLNTFSVSGTLSAMDGKALDPILEHNASLYVTSCDIDQLEFNFVANSEESTGELTLLYHGLDIAVKNKNTNDTTGLKAKFISFVANNKLLDSNPLPRKEIRVGNIYFKRNPERFLFSYCFKSILSGIKLSVIKEK